MLPRTDDTIRCIAERASRGPRYTSYPPATELRPISVDVVRDELAGIGRLRERVSLYLHVPFCRSVCAYCGCNVIPTRDATRGARYVDHLMTEMTLVARELAGAPVTELAIGGGSPNFLSPATLRTLVSAVDRYFAMAPDARRSIELDPRHTTTSQIEALAELGFRSTSMGVQDFAEPVQDAIRRHQTIAQTRWLVERARAAGFDDLNIDMVYGLPLQTEVSFQSTLDAVISLQPDRIALFGYAHLPDKLPRQRLVERAGRVLDTYERASLLVLAIERLGEAGYVHLGLDHFARPGSRLASAAAEGRMTRNFQGYIERRAETVVGLGTSAISSSARMHWQNHAELAPWEHAIGEGQLAVARGFVLDDEDRIRGAIIERLMCDGEIDLAGLGRERGFDPASHFARELAELAAVSDLVSFDGARLRTTDIGRLLVRNVCMVFDGYRDEAARQRFSATV